MSTTPNQDKYSLYFYRAQVTNIVDGDTVDLIIDLGCNVQIKERVRLYGIDTPERGQQGWREATERVRFWTNAVKGRGLKKGNEYPFLIETHHSRKGKEKKGKYGRWLATLWNPSDLSWSLNQRLVSEGLAVPYT